MQSIPRDMTFKEKSITIKISDEEYSQLYDLARAGNMSLRDFIKSLATLLTDNKSIIDDITPNHSKKAFEDDLQNIAQILEKKQHFIDLLLRTVYSSQLRLEGQIKKHRKEAEKELKKDIDRISLIVDPSSDN